MCFALNKEKFEGGVIEFDLNFDQIELDYESLALTVVNKEEFCEQKLVLKLRSKNQLTAAKKRKFKKVDEAELSNAVISWMKSMDNIVKRDFLEREMGQAGLLRRRTCSKPRKWKCGKRRVTIQYGCCYNFAHDKEGNLPGIVCHDEVDPLPSFIKRMIKRLVTWCILLADCIPNSCIVNIYEAGDCSPPHVDYHDFTRPFCTVSFINKCNIMFGIEIQIVGDGEF
ncbi:uncharacterized protein LOC110031918 [Phalaenopsis equestris]|uniref:uncharacterized protein LOC110031918 n=1 Tax=Phalaenopsis equestris TaxID=78828 RepID=UPI0009E4B406|nr:uncharacterized protein LOC110031918 [Phalaenopsis equestris]